MNGAYLRAAIKAEVKRCRMRGEDRIRSRYLAEECGLPIAAHVPEVRRAVRTQPAKVIQWIDNSARHAQP